MSQKKYNIAIVGATGLVGRTMLQVMEERKVPVARLHLLATASSKGKEVKYNDKTITVDNIENFSFKDTHIALFSAGKEASSKYIPRALAAGCIVIDNGSFWRMHSDVPLVVPEVNPDDLREHHGLIANPNCSTIQLAVALKPLSDLLGLKRVVVSTYQSISGAGQKGLNQLYNELKTDGIPNKGHAHPIAYNTIFHNISDRSGFSEEEIKMKNELRKILHQPELPVAVTCVRLPIVGGHGESVNIETNKKFKIADLRRILRSAKGLKVIDNPQKDVYPTAQLANGQNDVFVGRLRMDDSVESGAYLWVVADNVRKGAATNAVQIAEYIMKHRLLDFVPSEKIVKK